MKVKEAKTDVKDKKGARTRETIIRAARRVFSKHPYQAASMRMIGKEAGIEHPLINYYFPSKADLFKTIITDIYNELVSLNEQWFEEVRSDRIKDGFMGYVDRLLEYNQKNPESYRTIALNMSQAEDINQIPGYQQLPELIEKIYQVFVQKLSPRGPVEDIRMYIHTFTVLAISFLGSSPCVAQVQGMDPCGTQYREWVRNTFSFIFIPRLREIINPRSISKNAGKKAQF